MVKLCRLSLLFVLTLAFLIPGAASAVEDVVFEGPDGYSVVGHRCGTHQPTDFELERNALAVERWQTANGTARAKADVTIPVAVHVIRMDDGSCDVTDTQISDSISVLNAAYAGYGFQFTLASTDRYDNSRWSTARYGSRQALTMKQSTAIDPANNFNVWFANIGGGLLGYATFPDMYPEDDPQHGVVALYSSVPGGTAAPYNEGDTLTHEAGHYLGLYHTFQGGCTEPNDYCDDTPQEASPAYGCPSDATDTCPSDPGTDPIHNFMDYVDDYCMDEFTSDQAARMFEQMSLYRPSLMGGSTGTAPTANFSGTPTSGDVALTVQFTDNSAGSPTSWNWNFGDGGTSTAQNPEYTYDTVGVYSVTLTVANDYGSDSLTHTGYITVTEPGTGGGDTMLVDNVNTYPVRSGRKYYVRSTITIVDDGGAAVSGATVTVSLAGATGSAATGTDGTVTFTTQTKVTDPVGYCCTVTNVTHASYDWDGVTVEDCVDADELRTMSLAGSGIRGINPNPFNPFTKVSFYMATEGHASIKVYDVRGQVVETLFDGFAGKGIKSVTWNSQNFASGIYFCRFQSGDNVQTEKMTLVK